MAPPSNPLDYDAKSIESAGNEELMDWEPPKAQGLYDPQNEHEACGVGFIVAIDGKRNHKVGGTQQIELHSSNSLLPSSHSMSMFFRSINYSTRTLMNGIIYIDMNDCCMLSINFTFVIPDDGTFP